jgi:hypothetical protein
MLSSHSLSLPSPASFPENSVSIDCPSPMNQPNDSKLPMNPLLSPYRCPSPLLLPSELFRTEFELDSNLFPLEEDLPNAINMVVESVQAQEPFDFEETPFPETVIPQSLFANVQADQLEIRKKAQHNLLSLPKKKKNARKNIFRYMTRRVLRGLIGEEFEGKIREICSETGADPIMLKKLYQGKIESFTSIAELRREWCDQKDPYKKAFRIFSKWFLKYRAIRYILEGKMTDKLEFIHYKNHVLLKYIDQPKKFFRNK